MEINKLCPACKIDRYPMNESMENVHFSEFLGKNVRLYGVKLGWKIKKTLHMQNCLRIL